MAIDMVLEQALNESRLQNGALVKQIKQSYMLLLRNWSWKGPWANRGMCELFEDRPTSKSLGFFTVVFAERFCKENPGYTWRAL